MAGEQSTLSDAMGRVTGVRQRYRTDHRFRESVRQVFAGVVLAVILSWMLLPFFWTLQTSLKHRVVAQAYPPIFYGFEIVWSNFTRVLFIENYLPILVNGFVAASVATIVSITLGTPHAYIISKYSHRFLDASFFAIVAARVIPPISIAVPFFILFNKLGLLDTKIAVIMALTFLFEPFVVWIMKGFFDGLPRSLIDAARIDGCSKFQAFTKIMLPLSKPGLASSAIITWLLGWNHFVLVFILSATSNSQTVPVAILSLQRDHFTPWNLMAAAAIMGIIPSILVVIAFQNYLIRGLAERRTT